MTSEALPRWVWDVVRSLQRMEAEHPKLYVQTGDGYVQSDWCPGVALEPVPYDVQDAAKAITAYMDKVGP